MGKKSCSTARRLQSVTVAFDSIDNVPTDALASNGFKWGRTNTHTHATQPPSRAETPHSLAPTSPHVSSCHILKSASLVRDEMITAVRQEILQPIRNPFSGSAFNTMRDLSSLSAAFTSSSTFKTTFRSWNDSVSCWTPPLHANRIYYENCLSHCKVSELTSIHSSPHFRGSHSTSSGRLLLRPSWPHTADTCYHQRR